MAAGTDLPAEIVSQSISSGAIILPRDAALAAIAHMTQHGRRLENWEGWVRLRDGGRTRSLQHAGSFALPADAAGAAEKGAAGIRRAAEHWARNPEYAGAELYFGLTFVT